MDAEAVVEKVLVDFGDDWEHVARVVVETVGTFDETVGVSKLAGAGWVSVDPDADGLFEFSGIRLEFVVNGFGSAGNGSEFNGNGSEFSAGGLLFAGGGSEFAGNSFE